MRALTLRAPGVMVVEAVAVPQSGPGDVLVSVQAATTCGTDLKAFLRGHPQIPMPGPLGHEYAGVVVAGAMEPGTPVYGVHSAPCRHCKWCLRGQENLCESIMQTKVLGAYAEYLLVPQRIASVHLFPKPDHLSYAQAALLEPLSCVAQGVSLLPDWPAARVLVIGPGAIGLMFAAALKHEGHTVTLAGRNPERLAAGEQLGVDTVRLNQVAGGYDIVVECTGKLEVWRQAFDLTERGGFLMLFGGLPAGTEACFDATRLHYEQVSVLSPFHFGTSAVLRAKGWLEDATFDLSPLLSGSRTLDQAEETFRDLENGKGIKYVFIPGARL
jgi:L-iditol 2-dehydrogenase